MSDMGAMSPDSHSWSFDHRANGYARGEGFGMVVIKRLSDALRDGDTIRALIRASALNQDGRTPGITVPNGAAQGRLIKGAYESFGISRAPTQFFEAHGTGTAVGDPIEARTIGELFSEYRSKDSPLLVGSVKSNIGHLEGGSGVASLIKVIMMVERGVVLPNANFERINDRIDTDRLRIRVC